MLIICQNCNTPMKCIEMGIEINASLNTNKEGYYIDLLWGDSFECQGCGKRVLANFGGKHFDPKNTDPVDIEVQGGSWGYKND